jgi:hypothetical protein
MECSCNIPTAHWNDICEPISCVSAKIVTAHKRHICDECRQAITTGQEYERATFLSSDEWETHKTCQNCLSLRKQFFPGRKIFGGMREEIACHIDDLGGDLPEACIAALTPAARAWVCNRIEHTWALQAQNR